MHVNIETTLDEFREKVQQIINELEGNDTGVADRIANIASAYFEIPTGIAEIRATVEGYTVKADDDKAIKVTMVAPNTQDNRVKLAIIADSTVTIRTLQGDIEAVSGG